MAGTTRTETLAAIRAALKFALPVQHDAGFAAEFINKIVVNNAFHGVDYAN